MKEKKLLERKVEKLERKLKTQTDAVQPPIRKAETAPVSAIQLLTTPSSNQPRVKLTNVFEPVSLTAGLKRQRDAPLEMSKAGVDAIYSPASYDYPNKDSPARNAFSLKQTASPRPRAGDENMFQHDVIRDLRRTPSQSALR